MLLLDLSAVFDTVNHDYLLNHLKYRFGVVGTALTWFTDYLEGRTQREALDGIHGQIQSDSVTLKCPPGISPWTNLIYLIYIPLWGYLQESWSRLSQLC